MTDGPTDGPTDGRTDGRTDRRTDKAGCRVACTRLKRKNLASIATVKLKVKKCFVFFSPHAGLDIKENYPNVLPLRMFRDAKLWANVGDDQIHNFQELEKKVTQKVDYQVVDLSKYNYEIYLYERPYLNYLHIYVGIVLEHKNKTLAFEYLRKDGAYWEGLKRHYNGAKDINSINGDEIYNPLMEMVMGGVTVEKKIHAMPLYGHHSPDRIAFNMSGGACPCKGGDLAHYPWGDTGGGWPTNYEEVTPICDAFTVDMKFWINLFVDWDDPKLAMGNAGFPRAKRIGYKVDANVYGRYTDPYLVALKKENPHAINLTPDGKIVQNKTEKHRPVVIPIEYATESYPIDFYAAPQVGLSKSTSLSDYCPKNCGKEPETCPKPKKQEPSLCPIGNPNPHPNPNPTGTTGAVIPAGGQTSQDALKMTYDIAKKVIGLALVLV